MDLHSQKGAIAILTVVIVGAATLLMAYSASLLGLGELEMGYLSQKGEETFFLTDGCIEEAMHRLRKNTNYSGSSLNLGSGSCIIGVSGSGLSRTITATGTIGVHTKVVSTELLLKTSTTSASIINWEEIK